VRVALGVDERLHGATRQDGQNDLGEQVRLEVRLGIERLTKPALQLGDAVVGDRVAAAVRTLGALIASRRTRPFCSSRPRVE